MRAWSARGGGPLGARGARAGAVLGLVGLVVLVVVIVAPRAGAVRGAIERTSAGDFVLVVIVGAVAMVLRTVAWQIAIDAAGARVRWGVAHSTSAAAYTVGLLSPYLGAAVRVALTRRVAPERVPTATQLAATEGALAVVEGVLVAALIVVSAFTLGISIWVALLVLAAAVSALAGVAFAARRLDPRRFAGGLALAREPRPLGLVALFLVGTIGAQLVRVGIVLASVGLEHSLLVVTAVFIASGASAILPIGTAASGAAAPLVALPAGGDLADAAAAGLVLTGGLTASCVLYLLVASSTLLRSLLRPRAVKG